LIDGASRPNMRDNQLVLFFLIFHFGSIKHFSLSSLQNLLQALSGRQKVGFLCQDLL
jgi:hypothetical protein